MSNRPYPSYSQDVKNELSTSYNNGILTISNLFRGFRSYIELNSDATHILNDLNVTIKETYNGSVISGSGFKIKKAWLRISYGYDYTDEYGHPDSDEFITEYKVLDISTVDNVSPINTNNGHVVFSLSNKFVDSSSQIAPYQVVGYIHKDRSRTSFKNDLFIMQDSCEDYPLMFIDLKLEIEHSSSGNGCILDSFYVTYYDPGQPEMFYDANPQIFIRNREVYLPFIQENMFDFVHYKTPTNFFPDIGFNSDYKHYQMQMEIPWNIYSEYDKLALTFSPMTGDQISGRFNINCDFLSQGGNVYTDHVGECVVNLESYGQSAYIPSNRYIGSRFKDSGEYITSNPAVIDHDDLKNIFPPISTVELTSTYKLRLIRPSYMRYYNRDDNTDPLPNLFNTWVDLNPKKRILTPHKIVINGSFCFHHSDSVSDDGYTDKFNIITLVILKKGDN